MERRYPVMLTLDNIGCLRATIKNTITSAQRLGATEYQRQLESCQTAIEDAVKEITSP